MAGRDTVVAQDDQAFVYALTASQRDLWGFIASVTGSEADADDVLQQVNLALWGKRHLYDHKKRFLPWALGFAAREARSHQRQAAKSRVRFCDETIDLIADEWSETANFAQDSRRFLKDCLQKLREADRTLIEHRYIRGLSASEIASRSGRSLSGVYRVLSRSLQQLHDCINRSRLESER